MNCSVKIQTLPILTLKIRSLIFLLFILQVMPIQAASKKNSKNSLKFKKVRTVKPSGGIDGRTTLKQQKMGLKHWQGKWQMGILAKSYEEETDKATSMVFELGSLFYVPFSSVLEFKGDLGFEYQVGHIQNRYENESSEGKVFANEALMRIKPFPYFNVDMGVIDQSFLQSNLLVSQRGFPGVRVGLGSLNEAAFKPFNLKLWAHYSIPTSTTFDDERIESEATPGFSTQTLEMFWNPIGSVELTAYATLYEFRDLPAIVAHKGDFWGNSVTGAIPQESQFAHEFKGYLLGGDFCLCNKPSYWSFKWGGQRLENTAAPDAFGVGQVVYGELKSPAFGGPRWLVRGESFFNESDTSPAYYNSSERGHNNRVGEAYTVGFEWDRWKIRLLATYVVSDLINSPDNTTQGPLDFAEIRWETYRVEF